MFYVSYLFVIYTAFLTHGIYFAI